ncbi:VacJ family lipoprotein [Spiribacter sp. C176]|uniref:VacJ family lipoprotein n=1 Tax=Spiribacter salilacus TaxID=2664894 RepID=A0A6N7QRQ9_9GAMM|nr:VacJ family lipoprotein [Spiribacter salilacus]MRH78089.1 VacJ family lipoprotein [Spiribacter salilacus]
MMEIRFNRFIKLGVMLLVASLLIGCASTNGPEQVNDPLESVNRGVFTFNEQVDIYAVGPLSRGWVAITTDGMRTGVTNFYRNLAAPGHALNAALQGKWGQAGEVSGRFVVNSTIGLLGLFDPAASMGLNTDREDFGQTLGVWGVEQGPYLVLPLLGSSSTRDVARYPVDWYTDALVWLALDSATLGAFTALYVINTRARFEQQVQMQRDAPDPYAFSRSAYLQRRQSLVYDGNPPLDEDPYSDFFDELEGDN